MAFILHPAATSFLARAPQRGAIPSRRSLPRLGRLRPRAAVPTPVGDRVLVRLEKPLEQTASGLLLSTGSEEQTQKSGIVAAVGPGKQLEDGRRDRSGIEVGDRVMWQGYGASEVKVGDEKFMVVRMSDICGKC